MQIYIVKSGSEYCLYQLEIILELEYKSNPRLPSVGASRAFHVHPSLVCLFDVPHSELGLNRHIGAATATLQGQKQSCHCCSELPATELPLLLRTASNRAATAAQNCQQPSCHCCSELPATELPLLLRTASNRAANAAQNCQQQSCQCCSELPATELSLLFCTAINRAVTSALYCQQQTCHWCSALP